MSSVRPTHPAIVLGTEVNGLAVIRSLGRLGVHCAAVRTPIRGDHTPNSRYLAFTHSIALDATDDDLIAALREVSRRLAHEGPVVVIPTTDRFAEFLSRSQERLGSRFLACCPDRGVADAFLDKWKTAQLSRANGIRIPRTACPSTEAELESDARDLSFPVIVKPRYTYGTGFPGKNAVFQDAFSLRQFFSNTQLLGKCVVQEIIPSGDGDILVTSTYSGVDGRVRAIYSGRKLRQYLPDYGATCFGISERHADLEGATRSFLDALRYQGFAALEFARSRRDGHSYFLELNTRTYYHNQLFADAGVDLTQIAYADRTGQLRQEIEYSGRQIDGIVWLDFRRDFQSMRLKRRSGQIAVSAWLGSLIKARSFAVWDWRDPKPFVCACAWRSFEMLSNLLRRLLR